MKIDPQRDFLRHLLATIVFRGGVAVSGAAAEFGGFKIKETIRTPAELLAHIGDLLEGSLYLFTGEFMYLNSPPLEWEAGVTRFYKAARELDLYLSSDEPLHQPIDKVAQGPMADALTHIGQIILLRRAAGTPVQTENYFSAELVPGDF